MRQQYLDLATHLVGDLAPFELHTWGAAARRLFALHKVRYPLADDPTKCGLDHDFEAFCELFSQAFRRRTGTMEVLGFEDRWSVGRQELDIWLDPAAWRDVAISDGWKLRRHITRQDLHRLNREQDDLSYWFTVD